jgi:hypothetical protein
MPICYIKTKVCPSLSYTFIASLNNLQKLVATYKKQDPNIPQVRLGQSLTWHRRLRDPAQTLGWPPAPPASCPHRYQQRCSARTSCCPAQTPEPVTLCKARLPEYTDTSLYKK